MLFGGSGRTVPGRILAVLVAAGLSFGVAMVAGWAGGLVGLDWPPKPSGVFGVGLGIAAALLVAFEMLLWPRKLLRGRRLGSTRVWVQVHVWVGFVSLPVVVAHAGFGWGGPLPATTLALFLAVYASGVWGLILQQWLPSKLLADLPGETVAAEGPQLAEGMAESAFRLVGAAVADGADEAELTDFRDRLLLPYLRKGRKASDLGRRAEAERWFNRLAAAAPPAARGHVDKLREVADARRQLDTQRAVNGWLHGWLVVHLPLSVAMTGLMVLHAVRALKYW